MSKFLGGLFTLFFIFATSNVSLAAPASALEARSEGKVHNRTIWMFLLKYFLSVS